MTTYIEYYYNITHNTCISNFFSYLESIIESYEDVMYLNYNYEKFNIINNNFQIIKNYNPIILNFFLTYSIIIVGDRILVILFGSKARWFQLHSLINFIISINIFKDYLNIIINPNSGYRLLDNHILSYFILNLHIFHFIAFKNLGFYDYFHHLLFVGLGVLPTIIIVKTNQCYMGYMSCSGIPGIIEYFILSLYKNNKISLIKQKYINSINYNYFRFPLCIIGATYNFINYNNGNISDNYLITIYINILLFLNGSLFNYLTLQSYFEKKYNKMN